MGDNLQPNIRCTSMFRRMLKCNYSTEHWTREKYDDSQGDLLIRTIPEVERATNVDITAGMAVEWLKEVVKYNLPVQSMPNIRLVHFMHFRFLKHSPHLYPALTGLDTARTLAIESPKQMIRDIWNSTGEQ